MIFENKEIQTTEAGEMICPVCQEDNLKEIKIFHEDKSFDTGDYFCNGCLAEFHGNDKDRKLI